MHHIGTYIQTNKLHKNIAGSNKLSKNDYSEKKKEKKNYKVLT